MPLYTATFKVDKEQWKQFIDWANKRGSNSSEELRKFIADCLTKEPTTEQAIYVDSLVDGAIKKNLQPYLKTIASLEQRINSLESDRPKDKNSVGVVNDNTVFTSSYNGATKSAGGNFDTTNASNQNNSTENAVFEWVKVEPRGDGAFVLFNLESLWVLVQRTERFPRYLHKNGRNSTLRLEQAKIFKTESGAARATEKFSIPGLSNYDFCSVAIALKRAGHDPADYKNSWGLELRPIN